MFRLLSPVKLTVRDALQQKQNATDTTDFINCQLL